MYLYKYICFIAADRIVFGVAYYLYYIVVSQQMIACGHGRSNIGIRILLTIICAGVFILLKESKGSVRVSVWFIYYYFIFIFK